MSHEHRDQRFYISLLLHVYILNIPVMSGPGEHLAQRFPQLLAGRAGVELTELVLQEMEQGICSPGEQAAFRLSSLI